MTELRPCLCRSGLVAAEEAAQPFQYCDVVSTTTHKSLRGPRAGMIFFRRVRDNNGRVDEQGPPATCVMLQPLQGATIPMVPCPASFCVAPFPRHAYHKALCR